MQLFYQYGVRQVHGFLYGFQGFIPKYAHPMVELTPESVKGIHSQGGSILMSSRGHQDIGEIVDCLEQNHLNLLFTIGGDGTLRGAHLIAQEVLKRGLKIAVIGVPKTIDNDIAFCVKTFGFETAFAKAVESIQSAHVEATGAPYGIVIVKLMGRDSGFIAANTSLACPDVNVVLVPELPFTLDGENGLLKVLERRLRKLVEERRHPHAVIAVAEGAGQELMESSGEQDPSGNVRYGDIGQFLKAKITEYFKDKLPINLKSIEPSYMIRSLPANPSDAIFCFYLADHVVHAAMAGKTDMMVGFWNGHFTHVPLTQVTKGRKKIDTGSDFWRQVLYSTGQPARML
jgi:6-phosphofructokinase 1